MRIVILGGISLLFLSITTPAQADPQDDALEAMTACRAIKADPVRLACMDAATQFLNETTPTPPPVTPVAPSPVPRAPAVSTPTTPAASVPEAPTVDPRITAEAAATERAAIAAEREAIAAERAALASERAAIETAAATAPVVAQQDGPSLLERLRPAATNEAFSVQIVEIIRRRRSRKLRFITDEGLVFEQALDRINFHPPSALPAEATISFGTFASKWIRFAEEPDRKYKVSIQD